MDHLSPSHPCQRVVFMKGAQTGGPLALDTPLPTASGWTTMGAVQVGDALFDEKGQLCSVTSVSEIMTGRACFEVVFEDDATVVCDAEHRWPVWDCTNDVPVARVLRIEQMLGHGMASTALLLGSAHQRGHGARRALGQRRRRAGASRKT